MLELLKQSMRLLLKVAAAPVRKFVVGTVGFKAGPRISALSQHLAEQCRWSRNKMPFRTQALNPQLTRGSFKATPAECQRILFLTAVAI